MTGPAVPEPTHARAGRQTRRKPASDVIDTTDATMSTSHGPWKFDTRNCGTANDTPATSTAGHTSSMPRKPAYAQMSQNGTMSENSGSWRPTIALRALRSSPVTPCRAMIGVPSAPKATGAVFAMSESPDASNGSKPSAMSSAPVTATGVPKPAAPSKNAPKQNATNSSWSRRSPVRRVMPTRSSSTRPRSLASACRNSTLSTIQPIGKQPVRGAERGGAQRHSRRHSLNARSRRRARQRARGARRNALGLRDAPGARAARPEAAPRSASTERRSGEGRMPDSTYRRRLVACQLSWI